MDKKDKLLRYSIQVSYLGILLREGLLTEEEYADIVRGKATYEEIMKRKGVQNE